MDGAGSCHGWLHGPRPCVSLLVCEARTNHAWLWAWAVLGLVHLPDNIDLARNHALGSKEGFRMISLCENRNGLQVNWM